MATKTPTGIDLSAIRQQLQNKVEEELETQLRAIPETVQHVVDSAIKSIIGVTGGNGGYRVDTFSKREESLHGFIKRAVDKKLEEIVGPAVEKELKRVMKLVTLQRDIGSSIHNTLRWNFESGFKEKLGEGFKALGEKFGKVISDELEAAMEDVGNFNDDILDPDSFQGRIGELFLEEIAAQTAGS